MRADLTVVGAALEFDPLDVARSGRTNLGLLDEYFASAAVTIVAPEHAQKRYRPRGTRRIVVHTNDDVSGFVGAPFEMPPNDRRGEPGSDPMVGSSSRVRGTIERAVELASGTRGPSSIETCGGSGMGRARPSRSGSGGWPSTTTSA